MHGSIAKQKHKAPTAKMRGTNAEQQATTKNKEQHTVTKLRKKTQQESTAITLSEHIRHD